MARGSYKSKSKHKFQKKRNNRSHKPQFAKKPNFAAKKRLQNKRKLEENNKHNLGENVKRQKTEIVTQSQRDFSSESEEEAEDAVKQLLHTFNVNETNKKSLAIDSEDSESCEEVTDHIEQDNTENNSKNSDVDSSDNKYKSIGEAREGISTKESTELKNESELSESEEEDEIDQETSKEDNESSNKKDPFVNHFCYDLNDQLLESLQNKNQKDVINIEWPNLGKLIFAIPKCQDTERVKSSFVISEQKIYASSGTVPTRINKKKVDFSELNIKSQIHDNIRPANKGFEPENNEMLSPLQCELFSVINNYQDLYFPSRTFENAEEIRFIYSLHAINHVLKTRIKVLHHNSRLSKKDEVPDEYRDQGLVRPKVLIIVPFRDSALKIVNILIDLLVPNDDKGQVINKNRFMDDFSGGELVLPKKNPKPQDYECIFTGNCDDTFKIGIKVTKKSLKLYSDFYSSDIIIASPLGLRLIIGAEGEKERDYDFLASIELLILDQTDIFLMQNWDHILHTLNHIHMQPKQSHGTDFSRVRNWTLNGWSKYYRQTLIFSSLALPEINSIFNKKCHNYAGAAKSVNPIKIGAIVNVCVQVPQVYRKFDVDNVVDSINSRFEIFVNKILPQYKDSIMKQCLIYVPNYFDYVRIRNYFKREDVGFVQICEYSKDAKVARARDMFFHGDAHFLLYSERFHFFRRIRIKGIRHIIFYQPPTFPHFYSEMCNLMQEANQNKKCGSMSNMTVTIIYSKYDLQQIAGIVGTSRLLKMTSSNKNFHMFTNSDT